VWTLMEACKYFMLALLNVDERMYHVIKVRCLETSLPLTLAMGKIKRMLYLYVQQCNDGKMEYVVRIFRMHRKYLEQDKNELLLLKFLMHKTMVQYNVWMHFGNFQGFSERQTICWESSICLVDVFDVFGQSLAQSIHHLEMWFYPFLIIKFGLKTNISVFGLDISSFHTFFREQDTKLCGVAVLVKSGSCCNWMHVSRIVFVAVVTSHRFFSLI